MLRLHGMARSNYFGMVCTALYEKGLEFEHVQQLPNQENEWLERSPMGKVPALETEAGTLTETQVILDYLEAIAPEPALLPADPFARGKVQELSRTAELYIDLVTRRLLPAVFFGAPMEALTKEQVSGQLDRGIASARRLARFEPWIAGEVFSQADIIWHFSLGLSALIAEKVYGRDLYAEIPSAAAHRDAMEARASVQRVRALSAS